MGLIYPEVKVWLVVAMGGSGSGGGDNPNCRHDLSARR